MEDRVIAQHIAHLRKTFNSGRTRSLSWRMGQLRALYTMVEENSDAIVDALKADLGKPTFEAWAAEVGVALRDLKEAMKSLAGWMKPERVGTPLVAQPGSSRRYKDPLGVVLIIAPWNYPFNLVIAPLLGAIAAGNTVLVKPSEVAEHTGRLLAELLPEYMDTDAVAVIEGGVEETTAILTHRFDHIFYTGNGFVGRIVMTAAAKHLTPVTLELGGKSPVYVHKSADLVTTARRLAWGKYTNSGQTCIAPDYVLADEEIHDQLVDQLEKTIAEFYGGRAQAEGKYGRIINSRHHSRLMALMGSGHPRVGGSGDSEDLYIEPTVLTDVAPDSPVMSEEIFGPILPIIRTSGPDGAIEFINGREKPLALYIFTKDNAVAERLLECTSSGGATVNHVMLHYAVPNLPFGGVGESGMGAYHGRASFDTFSHHKSVLKKPFAIDPSIMYPPYDESKEKWLKRLL